MFSQLRKHVMRLEEPVAHGAFISAVTIEKREAGTFLRAAMMVRRLGLWLEIVLYGVR
ncbi:MAG TPA: hypothetical protein VEG60_31950 [Candidatus Binatia bacterium]|nr:hypothetical protein [Candidatus Binatia bacterium]